jgi:hypothetical protein
MNHLLARPTSLPFGLALCDRVRPKAEFVSDPRSVTCDGCLAVLQAASLAPPASAAPATSAPATSAPAPGLRPLGASSAPTSPALSTSPAPSVPKIGLRPLGASAAVTPAVAPASTPNPVPVPVPEMSASVAPADAEDEDDMDLDFEALQEHYGRLRSIEATLPDVEPGEGLEEGDADAALLLAVKGALEALGLTRIPGRLLARCRRGDTFEEVEEVLRTEPAGEEVPRRVESTEIPESSTTPTPSETGARALEIPPAPEAEIAPKTPPKGARAKAR